MVLLIALIAVIVVSANSCNNSYEIEPEPAGDPSPLLASGEYRLAVVDARAIDCQGTVPADFVGQQAWGYLDASRAQPEGAVRFELEGIPLDGTMVPGALSVGGSLLVDEPSHPPETDTDEDVDYADTGADPTRGGSSSGSNGGSADSGDEADRPPQGEAWATLEANIQQGNHAMGVLVIHSAGCSYELDVSMDLASGDEGVDTAVLAGEDTGAVYAEEGDADTAVDG